MERDPAPAKHSPHILIPFLTLSTNCPKSQELDERDPAKHPPHPHPLPALFQPLSRSQGCWDHPTLTQLRDPLEALPVLIPALDPDPGSGSRSPVAHRESKLERSHYRHHRGPKAITQRRECFPLCVFPLSISNFYPLVSLSSFYPLVSLHSGKGSSLFLCTNKYILYRK